MKRRRAARWSGLQTCTTSERRARGDRKMVRGWRQLDDREEADLVSSVVLHAVREFEQAGHRWWQPGRPLLLECLDVGVSRARSEDAQSAPRLCRQGAPRDALGHANRTSRSALRRDLNRAICRPPRRAPLRVVLLIADDPPAPTDPATAREPRAARSDEGFSVAEGGDHGHSQHPRASSGERACDPLYGSPEGLSKSTQRDLQP